MTKGVRAVPGDNVLRQFVPVDTSMQHLTLSEKLQAMTQRLHRDSDISESRFFTGRITQDFRNVTIAVSPAGRLLTHLANEWLRGIRGQGTIKPCAVLCGSVVL